MVTGSPSIPHAGESRWLSQQPINDEIRRRWLVRAGRIEQMTFSSFYLYPTVQLRWMKCCKLWRDNGRAGRCLFRVVFYEYGNEKKEKTFTPICVKRYGCRAVHFVNRCKPFAASQMTRCCQLFVCSFGRHISLVSIGQRNRTGVCVCAESVSVCVCKHRKRMSGYYSSWRPSLDTHSQAEKHKSYTFTKSLIIIKRKLIHTNSPRY